MDSLHWPAVGDGACPELPFSAGPPATMQGPVQSAFCFCFLRLGSCNQNQRDLLLTTPLVLSTGPGSIPEKPSVKTSALGDSHRHYARLVMHGSQHSHFFLVVFIIYFSSPLMVFRIEILERASRE